jgi:hypothetical protein
MFSRRQKMSNRNPKYVSILFKKPIHSPLRSP